jgi:hypothetical protein
MQIFVKLPNGKTVTIDTELGQSVMKLKGYIAD